MPDMDLLADNSSSMSLKFQIINESRQHSINVYFLHSSARFVSSRSLILSSSQLHFGSSWEILLFVFTASIASFTSAGLYPANTNLQHSVIKFPLQTFQIFCLLFFLFAQEQFLLSSCLVLSLHVWTCSVSLAVGCCGRGFHFGNFLYCLQ